MSSVFESVPVVDVHNDNFKEVWPSLVLSIKTATFVAIDTELSGLGQRKLMMAKEIESRYKGTVESSKSRSIISLGLSCFRLVNVATQDNPGIGNHGNEEDRKSQSSWQFLVQTFNIVTLCQDEYVVEPASLQFLVSHGFDFNRQYAKGIPYYRGCDKTGKQAEISIRQLFVELLKSEVPVVFHNALVDLMFLYQNLYTNLPPSSSSFVADLTEMFPNGVIDTKYITDFVHRMPASYLEYVFKKCQRDNAKQFGDSQSCVKLTFPGYPDSNPNINYCYCKLPVPNNEGDQQLQEKLKATVCPIFAAHGNCINGKSCPKSHNIDLILDLDYLVGSRKSRKRKRRRENQQGHDDKNGCVSMETDEDQNTNQTDDSNSLSQGNINDISQNSSHELEPSNIENPSPSRSCDLSESHDQSQSPDPSQSHDQSQSPDPSQSHDQSPSQDSSKLHDVVQSQDPSQSHDSSDKTRNRAGGHRAGYDAFMTGFIMAYYVAQYGHFTGDMNLKSFGLEKLINNIYLSGKDVPLIIYKSAFAKTSKEHKTKFDKLASS